MNQYPVILPGKTDTMENAYIAEYGKLRARTTTGDDLDLVLALENHPENADFVLQWTRDKHLKLLSDDYWGHWIFEAASDGRKVGYTILKGMNRPERILHFNRLVISEKGSGFGSDAIRLVKKFAFEQLNVHRLWFDVYADNERAIALYRAEGFTQEARLRDHEFRGDRYRSMYIFGMLEHEYEISQS